MTKPQFITITFDSYHVFGSGAASATLTLDGVEVSSSLCKVRGWVTESSDNGFVGFIQARIPFAEFLSFGKVQYSRGAIPGGSSRFEGTPKEYIEWRWPAHRTIQRAAARKPHTGIIRAAALARLGWKQGWDKPYKKTGTTPVYGVNPRDGSRTCLGHSDVFKTMKTTPPSPGI